MMNNKKGGALILIGLLVALFIASILFLSFLPVVAELIYIVGNDSSVAASPQAVLTLNRTEGVWYTLPVICFIIIIIWAVNRGLRKEPVDYEGGF